MIVLTEVPVAVIIGVNSLNVNPAVTLKVTPAEIPLELRLLIAAVKLAKFPVPS